VSDPLTGLPNRRHLDAALAARLEDLRRYGWPFGLLIADIDHFKAVNDHYGHDAGDAALRSVAATIGGGVRSGDIAGRWGGEEFVVLANGGDERSLGEIAERLRALVASSRVMVGGSQVSIRISVGAAAAHRSDGPHELLARADAALYDAKAAGRDRVVVAGTGT
jgi:diguanylate cyclase (GGDEF)-like protein